VDPGGGPEGALLVVGGQNYVAALSHMEYLLYHQFSNAKSIQIDALYRQIPIDVCSCNYCAHLSYIFPVSS
jgi:hypothetical protein